MSKNNNIRTLNEALPMLRELENECGEDMPIYNVITEISFWKQGYTGWLSG